MMSQEYPVEGQYLIRTFLLLWNCLPQEVTALITVSDKHGKKPSGSIKGVNIYDHLSDCKLIKKHCTWN